MTAIAENASDDGITLWAALPIIFFVPACLFGSLCDGLPVMTAMHVSEPGWTTARVE